MEGDHSESEEHSVQDLHGGEEVFLDDDDIAEIQEMMDEEGDVPMDDEDAVIELEEDHDTREASLPAATSDDLPDTSSRRFDKHESSVFTISSHPKSPILVVSGGEDDLGYLWRTDTGEQIAKLTGHTDSVVASGWSNDGELVATGGMDGRIRVWRRVKNVPPGAWEYSRWEFLTVLEGMEEILVSNSSSRRSESSKFDGKSV